ncbi:MAG: LptF/LptG family permease [Candidatus Omnitrophica bacterium]|nr:LptF/LptG family permease [Candidatus Omnitrophota bacterium]
MRNYIFGEVAKPFWLYMFIFTFVLVSGNIIRLIELIIIKGISLLDVMRLFLWQIPSLISYILPMAILTALLLGLGRLSSDLEITAIKASGINIFHLELPLVLTGVIFSLFSLILNNEIIPYARFASRKIIKQVGIKNPTAYFEPGTFIRNFENYILFFYGINGNMLYNIRIYELKEDGLPRTIIAQQGKITTLTDKKTVKLELFVGTSDEPSPNDPRRFYKLNFKTYTINLKIPVEFMEETINKKPKEMNIQELISEKEKLSIKNIDISPIETEIHKKIALSFACLVFVFVGFPLGVLTKRRTGAVAFGLSLVVLGLYYLIMIGGEALAIQRLVKPPLAMWLANIILGIMGVILNIYVYKN